MIMFSHRMIARVKAGATTSLEGIHGPLHWERVWRNAKYLADQQRGISLDFLALFSLFHDSQRQNDDDDPAHGKRAAMYLEECYQAALSGDADLVELAEYPVHLIDAVKHACTIHTACQPGDEDEHGIGECSSMPEVYKHCTVLCMDADRLDVWRVNGPVDANALFTEEARRCAEYEYAAGFPKDYQDQLRGVFPFPMQHVVEMNASQREMLRRLFNQHDDGCFEELDLFLRVRKAADGAIELRWCKTVISIDKSGRALDVNPDNIPPEMRVVLPAAIDTSFRKTMPLYHYTTWDGLVGILAAGEIRPSTYEEPYAGVWCSHARVIERALPGMHPVSMDLTDREAIEAYDMDHGMARIEVNPRCAPLTIGPDGDLPMDDFLEADESRYGSCSKDWRLGRESIKSKDWLSVQVWSSVEGWHAIERSINPRVRAIWPLLPTGMRAGQDLAIMDPDYLLDNRTLRAGQIQRFVDRLDAARYRILHLIACGELSAASALATANSCMIKELQGLPILYTTACQCDFAFLQCVLGHSELAEVTARKALESLYGTEQLQQVICTMESQGFGDFLRQRTVLSPSIPCISSSEIMVYVMAYLLIGRHDDSIKSRCAIICGVLTKDLPGVWPAKDISKCLSLWLYNDVAAANDAGGARIFSLGKPAYVEDRRNRIIDAAYGCYD